MYSSISLRGLRIHEDLRQDSRNLNWVPPKYKPAALPSERTCWATLKQGRTTEANRIVQTIENSNLGHSVQNECDCTRPIIESESPCPVHFTKMYAAVATELHSIFKFGSWLTVSSQFKFQPLNTERHNSRYFLHALRWMPAMRKEMHSGLKPQLFSP